MSKFSKDFFDYFNYVKNNSRDIDYSTNCEKYRKVFLMSLNSAELYELEKIIERYHIVLYMDDEFELYKKYFELGGREENLLNNFLEYLWFWGDFDHVIPKLKEIVESKNNGKLERAIGIIINDGLDGLQKI